ncbi:hypothetical protein GCM10007852_10590 [Agaribacter marinus]|uniref:Uncharacterized protein n=1 Tax=Agaribacter marinus TaxID=1431249 RepID=A0AA37SYE2_9ALTE|nr:hypothetical protein GCM10007852_10590 [Agaribacter marinus]
MVEYYTVLWRKRRLYGQKFIFQSLFIEKYSKNNYFALPLQDNYIEQLVFYALYRYMLKKKHSLILAGKLFK